MFITYFFPTRNSKEEEEEKIQSNPQFLFHLIRKMDDDKLSLITSYLLSINTYVSHGWRQSIYVRNLIP